MACMPPFPDMQHRFTSELKSKDCVEDDHVVFSIDVEEDDAEVEWFKDGVPIIPDGKRYGGPFLDCARSVASSLMMLPKYTTFYVSLPYFVQCKPVFPFSHFGIRFLPSFRPSSFVVIVSAKCFLPLESHFSQAPRNFFRIL